VPAHLDKAHARLLKAAAFLEEHGHCKGHTRGFNGYCAIGALAYCDDKDRDYFPAERLLERALGRGDRYANTALSVVAAWNDAPERTKEEVIAKMRAVALGL
jgi:hypothetical protein